MLPREVISVGSLILRPPSRDDLGAIVRASSDAETARFLYLLPVPYTSKDAESYLELAERRWAEGGAEFSVVDAATGRYLGAVGLRATGGHGAHEIGYRVAEWARGRGVATAAARAVSEWAFDKGVRRIELRAEVENLASLRVAYAAGYLQEGIERERRRTRDGRPADFVAFARLAADPGEAVPRYLPLLDAEGLSDGVVRLAPVTLADAPDFHRLLSAPSITRWMMAPPSTIESTERRCRYTGYWWLSGQRVELAVRDAATDAFAGHIQLAQIAPLIDQAMLGYSLLPAFRGKGYMSRAVRLLVDWAFANTALHRIVAGTDVTNEASQMVLERAGFSREAVHRELFPRPDGTRGDDVEWLLLRPHEG
ncbi:GNAT family N-acetyltransferase [Nonomuraea dietziae]|uniref:RimJ/RimL family protein N-acetyltransferase n=1 Tax=Nonomuraea dietziae TaxID=65515 RepID=A0A7W5VJY7_9ACTN|nr:GNAT family N-acetyltransferase [Nonomuraea dietziae]MBB3733423.1 RimJ/RimL family protein N-acetyltransferase [Nonomuraea dietziae]